MTSSPRVLTGRLNVFQRLARTWDVVHPYNGAQACRVAGSFDAGRVALAWNEALRLLGLGAATASHRRFAFQPAPHQSVNILPAGASSLEQHFTTELNRAFIDPGEPPFRPFVLQGDDAAWLGLVYQHWVADSFSVRLILQTWLDRLRPSARRAPTAPPSSPLPSRKLLADADLLGLSRRFGQYRRTRKVHTMGPLDRAVRVRLLETPDLIPVPSLLRYARERGVRLNDVFLAALAEACDPLIPAQARPGREDLAVSFVVDLRPRLVMRYRDDFGCLLGFGSAVCRPAELRDWDRLLRAVSAQRSQSTGMLWMLAAELVSRFAPPHRVYDFYRKEAPFTAGLSNVNLKGTWFDARHPRPVSDYVRVSPTGPMVPLALNVTTLGTRLRLSMTYRSNLLNDWSAAEVAQGFVRRLNSLD